MRLEEVANVVVGQIMTRVSDENDQGKKVEVLVPKAVVEGIIMRKDLGKAFLVKEVDDDKYTKEGDVIIKLSTPYDAAYVTKENVGLVIPSFCAAIRIMDSNKINAQYLSAFLNSSHVRKQLIAKVSGANRPMIRVTDVRALELPNVSTQDMETIGAAFMLSGQKKSILFEMISMENEIMQNIVLKSIKEGMGSV